MVEMKATVACARMEMSHTASEMLIVRIKNDKWAF